MPGKLFISSNMLYLYSDFVVNSWCWCYRYEILTENLMDPAHLPYAHYGLLDLKKNEDPGRYISLILMLQSKHQLLIYDWYPKWQLKNSVTNINFILLSISYYVELLTKIWSVHSFTVETDREGGTPLKLTIEKSDISGFDAEHYKFIAPYVVYFTVFRNFSVRSSNATQLFMYYIFYI